VRLTAREALLRALLVAGSLLLVFVVCEAALRFLYIRDRTGSLQEQLERSRATSLEADRKEHSLGGLVQSSPFEEVVFELKPGLRGTYRGQPLETNSAGQRDREYPRRKAAGTYRIAGLGDSVMFGWAIREEQSYLALLEEWLNTPAAGDGGRTFEVLNFAVPGYNTAIEVATFEHKVLPRKPDLVILHFVSNDMGVPKFMLRPPDPLSPRRSYFADLVRSRLGLLKEERASRLVGYRMGSVEDAAARAEILSRYDYMVGERGFRRAMKKLGRLTRSRNIRVLVLVGSNRGRQGRTIRKAVQRNGFDMLEIGPVTRRVFADHGFPDDAGVRRRKLRVAPGDSHPGAFGHYIYTVGLWEKLQEMGIIPSAPAPACLPGDVPPNP
jgi:hypothetical protein